jgi:hypothetical protein
MGVVRAVLAFCHGFRHLFAVLAVPIVVNMGYAPAVVYRYGFDQVGVRRMVLVHHVCAGARVVCGVIMSTVVMGVICVHISSQECSTVGEAPWRLREPSMA